MAYEELDFENGIEITSVSSYVEEIRKLKEEMEGGSTELFFRGQEAEFWGIEPSIFRNDMLSVEHKLMQLPLQKNPFEFKELRDNFEIMTKYQHYGMCTRLLDLTTNPLVALYFACKHHGNEVYINADTKEEKEPYGIVYFKDFYPKQSDNIEVRIITTLAKYDLTRENTISSVLLKLTKDRVIDKNSQSKWLKDENIKEFIKIIQENYLVTPTYSNERLKKQCGVFLLCSAFTVDINNKISTGVITKSKKNLRSEFSDRFFYINGEKKEDIIKELDLYNINEATLFPEIDHQLNYIKNSYQEKTKTVSDFHKFEEEINKVISFDNINDDEINEEFVKTVKLYLYGRVNQKKEEDIIKIIEENLVVDWYKREKIKSKIKMSLITYFQENEGLEEGINPKNIVEDIMERMDKIIKQKMVLNREGEVT